MFSAVVVTPSPSYINVLVGDSGGGGIGYSLKKVAPGIIDG
jgi:hypothetical protein